MANEATIRVGLFIDKGQLQFRSHPSEFRADVAGQKGPVPGAFTIPAGGNLDIDFSELVQPGLAVLRNIDTVNYCTYGVWDGTEFYPVGELLPGEFYPIRFSRWLGRSQGASGTGTADTGTYTLRFRADIGAVVASVEAFEV